MFTTFRSTVDAGVSPGPVATASQQPKRNQVARACDRCRLYRIKCDSHKPCRNCRARGSSCSNQDPSVTESKVNVDHLVTRIEELEERLLRAEQQGSVQALNPQPLSTQDGSTRDHGRQDQGTIFSNNESGGKLARDFGSHFEYMTRLKSLMALSAPLPIDPGIFQLTPKTLSSTDNLMPQIQLTSTDLTRSEEEYLLNLFWQSYQLAIPIVDEKELRDHYSTLWSNEIGITGTRSQSALVDIILALCLQYASTFAAQDDLEKKGQDEGSNSIPGYRLYERSQILLSRTSENLTLSSVQCQMYASLYMFNALRFNMAHQNLATAVRYGYILGLDQIPVHGRLDSVAAIKRRTWWGLFVLDTVSSSEAGIPYLIPSPTNHSILPDVQSLTASESHTLMHNDISWLHCFVQLIALSSIKRKCAREFVAVCSELMESNGGSNIYDAGEFYSEAANSLAQIMQNFRDWISNVPVGLQNSRSGGAVPFSTSQSPIELDFRLPVWLQRQRLLLQLFYHSVSMSLLKPYACLPQEVKWGNTIASELSVNCANHAISITLILRQMLSETGILSLQYQACNLQWTAILCLVGFTTTHPACPYSVPARKAISISIENLDILAKNNIPAAEKAAANTRFFSDMVNKSSSDFMNAVNGNDEAAMRAGNETTFPIMDPSASPWTDWIFENNMSSFLNFDTTSMDSIHEINYDKQNLWQ